MKDGSYYVIQSFMVNELKLKGNELLVYAIIYGFSQDGNSTFKGSLKYLSESTNLSKSTLQDVLKKLLDKNLIIKNDIPQNGFKLCEYYANLNSISKIGIPCRNSSRGIAEIVQECTENQHGGITEIGNNNIINNIDNKIENNIVPVEATPQAEPTTTTTLKEVKHKYGEYNHVLLTDKQYNSLVEKYGKIIIDRYITKIDEWIQLKGKSQYKDFNLAIQQWLKKDNVQPMVNSYQNQNNGGWWG